MFQCEMWIHSYLAELLAKISTIGICGFYSVKSVVNVRSPFARWDG